MRGLRVLSLVAAAAILAAGCGRHATEGTAPARSTAPAATAPKNPDFTAIVERFYQLVEGGHWEIAYAMCSDRYRAGHSLGAFESLYQGTSNADVHARQAGDRAVATTLAIAASGGAPARALHETLTFRWDGERWAIDGIAR